MQRVLYKGVPVWRDSEKNLYAYEAGVTPGSTSLKIGTESDGLSEDWKVAYEPRLQAFRQSLEVRNRKSTTPATSKK
jgi:hypothetical protein